MIFFRNRQIEPRQKRILKARYKRKRDVAQKIGIDRFNPARRAIDAVGDTIAHLISGGNPITHGLLSKLLNSYNITGVLENAQDSAYLPPAVKKFIQGKLAAIQAGDLTAGAQRTENYVSMLARELQILNGGNIDKYKKKIINNLERGLDEFHGIPGRKPKDKLKRIEEPEDLYPGEEGSIEGLSRDDIRSIFGLNRKDGTEVNHSFVQNFSRIR